MSSGEGESVAVVDDVVEAAAGVLDPGSFDGAIGEFDVTCGAGEAAVYAGIVDGVRLATAFADDVVARFVNGAAGPGVVAELDASPAL